MVEMHLLSVNVDFRYNPIYALGVVSAFDRFMNGYRPERDKDSIFEALCRSTGSDPGQYRQDANTILDAAEKLSKDELTAIVSQAEGAPSDNAFAQQMAELASAEIFKYSRLFGIGVLSAIERTDAELLADAKALNELLDRVSASLNITDEKLKKDLDLYRSNLEKMEQTQAVMADILAADRKKRAEREQAKQAAAEGSDTKADSSDSSEDESKSEGQESEGQEAESQSPSS